MGASLFTLIHLYVPKLVTVLVPKFSSTKCYAFLSMHDAYNHQTQITFEPEWRHIQRSSLDNTNVLSHCLYFQYHSSVLFIIKIYYPPFNIKTDNTVFFVVVISLPLSTFGSGLIFPVDFWKWWQICVMFLMMKTSTFTRHLQ